MNFIAAIQHATIGYGIRRKSWSCHRPTLCLNYDEICLVATTNGTEEFSTIREASRWVGFLADFEATDWETI